MVSGARGGGPSEHSHVLLLTGRPGVGKTTAVVRAARRLDDLRVRGFYTEETREEGRRTGFELVTLDGRRRTMASVDLPGPPRVSRYGVDLEAVDAFTASELEAPGREDTSRGEEAPGPDDRATDLYLVDEIGKMECHSERFVAAVRRLLVGDTPLVATVARRGGGLIREVKESPASELWEVTGENREQLPERLTDWVRARAEV